MQVLIQCFDFIMRGGFMMYPLLLSGLVALSICIERALVFRRLSCSHDSDRLAKVLELIRTQQIEQAKQICQKPSLGLQQNPTLSVLLAGMNNFHSSVEAMELSMKNQAEAWLPYMEKRIEILDTIITAAPLLGLLGTITGMMGSFQGLSERGLNEPGAITGGVAEALIATATGLIIALFCLVAYNYFNSRLKAFIFAMESSASQLMEIKLSKQASDRQILKAQHAEAPLVKKKPLTSIYEN